MATENESETSGNVESIPEKENAPVVPGASAGSAIGMMSYIITHILWIIAVYEIIGKEIVLNSSRQCFEEKENSMDEIETHGQNC